MNSKTQKPVGRTAELVIGSDLSNLSEVRQFLRQFCESALQAECYPEEFAGELAELELAATELVSNIIRHGFEGLPEGVLNIECWFSGVGQLVMQIIHAGRPYTYDEENVPEVVMPKEGGMGLYLISMCVDSISNFVRPDGTSQIRLIKTLTLN